MYSYEHAEAVATELRRYISEEEYEEIGVETVDNGTALVLLASRNGRTRTIKLDDLSNTGLKLAAEDLLHWFLKRELN